MIKTVVEITKLIASEGKYLTNGTGYCKVVYLGCNDKPENWHEITEAEYNRIQKKKEEELEL